MFSNGAFASRLRIVDLAVASGTTVTPGGSKSSKLSGTQMKQSAKVGVPSGLLGM